MSNMPENENKQLNEVEESSTIFSNPTTHKNSANEKKKVNRFYVILSVVLVVAILVGGTFGIVKLIDKKEDPITETPISEIKIPLLSENVDSIDPYTITNVNITNKSGSYKLYSVKEKDTTSSSSTSRVVNWYIDGIDRDLIDTYSTSNIVMSLSDITAFKEITSKSTKDCGFDSPLSTAILSFESGETVKILLGAKSPDGSGSYLKVDGNDKIYLVDSSVTYIFQSSIYELANNNPIGAFPISNDMEDYLGTDGALGKFEKLTITGKNFPKPVIIEKQPNEQLVDLVGYVTTSPTNHVADGINYIFDAFKNGISISGTYSYDKSEASIKKFGLDNPDFVATMEIGSVKHTIKFKQQSIEGDVVEDEGNVVYYAVISDDSKLIQKVNFDSIPFVNQTTKDFYSSWVCLISIDDISAFTMQGPDGTHKFEIADVEDEEADIRYTVAYNGKNFNTDTFQDLYFEVVSLPCNDFTIDNVAHNPEYTFTFDFETGKSGTNVITFVKVSETRYQYYSDGVAMGKVTLTDLSKVLKAIEKATK